MIRKQHDPGPWKLLRVNMGDRIELRIIAGQREIVPDVFGDTEQERMLNAAVLTAAPEMLEVLKLLETPLLEGTLYDDHDAAVMLLAKVRMAIAYAEGRKP